MALEFIAANAPSQTYARINAAIALLNAIITSINGKAEQSFVATAFQQANDQRAAGDDALRDVLIAGLQTASRVSDDIRSGLIQGLTAAGAALHEVEMELGVRIDGEASARSTLEGVLRALIAVQAAELLRAALIPRIASRPGDVPVAFRRGESIATLAEPIPSKSLVAGDNGMAVRLRGRDIVAMALPVAVEPGRLYRARYVVQRRANASDPSNDTLRLAIIWREQGGSLLPAAEAFSIVEDMNDLVVADGRQERHTIFARSPGTDVLLPAPKRARYAQAVAWQFGLDAATDVEVLDIEDASSATVLDPVSADITARVSAIESDDLASRLSAIESQLQTPKALTFTTKNDAAAATIPESVTTVELRGQDAAGDGGGGLFRRIGGALPQGADGFVSGGASFQRVVAKPDVVSAEFAAWFAALPTSLPAQAGVPWNNAGGIAVS